MEQEGPRRRNAFCFECGFVQSMIARTWCADKCWKIPLPVNHCPDKNFADMAYVNPGNISHRRLGSPFGAGHRVGIEE
jgi:hypothetical protein